jgi:hypothetical protein
MSNVTAEVLLRFQEVLEVVCAILLELCYLRELVNTLNHYFQILLADQSTRKVLQEFHSSLIPFRIWTVVCFARGPCSLG